MNEDLAKQLSDMLSEKNIDLNQVLDNFKANSSEENTQEKTSSFDQFDTATLLKFQKLFGLLNSKNNSQDEQLLKALKPYMRDSKKGKIDQYIKLLHIMQIFEKFQEMGGNLNDFL